MNYREKCLKLTLGWSLVCSALPRVLLFVGWALTGTLTGTLFCSAASAQTAADAGTASELSLTELEEYVEREKKQLESVIKNREQALLEQAAIREKLEKEQARQKALEEELLQLCEEMNTANPKEPIDCEKELESS